MKISKYLKKQRQAIKAINDSDVTDLLSIIRGIQNSDGKIFIIGNGGSAANANHFAEDLAKGGNKDNKGKPFRVISLCSSVPYITAIGNDYDFDQIFSSQLKPLASANDLLITLSVSGRSPNLLKALSESHKLGMYSFALCGKAVENTLYETTSRQSDHSIVIQSSEYGIVEDCQMMILHSIIDKIMRTNEESKS